MGLVLGRKPGESVTIGDDIEVSVVRTTHQGCRLVIDAPKNVPIVRTELLTESAEQGRSQDGDRTDCDGQGGPFFDHEPLIVGGKHSL